MLVCALSVRHLKCQLCSCRWIRLGSKRLGWRRCSSLPEILTWWSDCDSDSSPWSFPPLARETLCRWADAWAVPHVHPVQSHERGFSLPPGNDGLQGGNRDASSQTGIQNKQRHRRVTAINTRKSEPQTSTVYSALIQIPDSVPLPEGENVYFSCSSWIFSVVQLDVRRKRRCFDAKPVLWEHYSRNSLQNEIWYLFPK